MRGLSLLSVLFLLALLLLFTNTPSQAQVCLTSDASAAAYDDGWQDGDNDGTGFGPWVQITTSADPNRNGFFVFTSTQNGDGVDDNGDGDIDTGNPGRAWGIYANNGQQAAVTRAISTPIGDGSTLSFEYDNGPVLGVQNNFTLRNAAGDVLMFAGVAAGYPQYAVFDQFGGRFTGAPNAAFGGEGILVDIEIVSSAGDYDMTITTLEDGNTYTVPGQFFATADPEVTLIDFNNNDNGPGVVHNLYVNSLQACYPDTDNDGVRDLADLCPGTVIPEGLPTEGLGINHFALIDGDTVFDTTLPAGIGPGRSYTTEDTGGCSCEQIIAEQGLGKGHTMFGCSISAMDDWVALVTGASKRDDNGSVAEVAAEAPEEYMLESNYPNPFNPTTSIRYSLPEASQVKLVVYDMLGRTVRVLVDGMRQAGQHEVALDAGDLPSGTYLYRLVTPEGSITKTMVLQK